MDMNNWTVSSSANAYYMPSAMRQKKRLLLHTVFCLSCIQRPLQTPRLRKFKMWKLLTFTGPCIVIYFCSRTNGMYQFFKFILFCSSTLNISDRLSVRHQEAKTAHTASGICHTDSADCLLAGTSCSISFLLASSQQNLFDIHLILYVQS
jgi:hypothetical protein